MKRITSKVLKLVLCILAIPIFGQQLTVAEGGALYVPAGNYLAANDGMSITGNGDLTLASNATLSSSLLVQGTTSGNITYSRNVPNANWHVLAAPVTNASIGAFIGNSTNAIATNAGKAAVGAYNNTNAATTRWTYASATGATGNFVSGKGYTFKRNATGLYNFKGAHASTTANTTIALTPVGTGEGVSDNWYAVGNPYPAFISVADIMGTNNAKFDSSYIHLQVWNGTDYEIANLLPGSPVTQIIPGQAFLVRMTDASQVFAFEPGDRTHQAIQTDFTLNKSEEITYSKIDITLSSGAKNKSTSIYYLNEDGSLGLDPGYDAGSFEEGIPSFTLATRLVKESKGINFALQALPMSALENNVVPLSVNATAGENLNFTLKTLNVSAAINTYIEDKIAATFTQLTANNSYSVTLSENIQGAGRFYFHTSEKSLGENEVVNANTLNFFKKPNENSLKIIGANNSENATVTLFNLLGKQVFTKTLLSAGNQTVVLPSYLATGVYITKVNQNNAVLVKKIILD